MLVKVYKWWWGWSPEEIEEWLERKEEAGWNLFHVDIAAIRFHFTKGAPRKIRYCADYQNTVDPDYMRLFQDDGWQLVYSYMGWYIWSKPYEGKKPAIYTDVESILGRNIRLNRVMSICAVIMILAQLPLVYMSVVERDFRALLQLTPLYVIAFAFFGYVSVQLSKSNARLKERHSR